MTFPPNYPSEPENNQNDTGAGGTPQNPYAAPGGPGATPPQQPPAFGAPAPGGYSAPGPYPAPGYPGAAPAYADPYGQSTVKNSLGVWALVLGILSFVSCGIFSAIPAVIVGNKGKEAADQGLANNRGMSQAGVILGWIGIALTIVGVGIWIILIIVGISVGGASSS